MTTKQIDVRYTNTTMGEPVAVVDFDAFAPTGNAFASSRCLSESDDYWAAVEYVQRGHISIAGEQRPAECVFLFSSGEIEDADGNPIEEDCYPWDAEHCARIRLVD